MSEALWAIQKINANELHARRAEVGAAAHEVKQLFRHRVDWHWLESGEIEAVLTITLPNGHEWRFRSKADPHELARNLAAANPEIGFSLKGLWKGVKKAAKSVATSKVFKLASTALMFAAPALGPMAPAVFAASAAMKGATALTAARVHAAKGNKAAAAKLVAYANKAAKAASVIAPPRAAAMAANPAAAAHQIHANAQRASSAKLYRLLIQPA